MKKSSDCFASPDRTEVWWRRMMKITIYVVFSPPRFYLILLRFVDFQGAFAQFDLWHASCQQGFVHAGQIQVRGAISGLHRAIPDLLSPECLAIVATYDINWTFPVVCQAQDGMTVDHSAGPRWPQECTDCLVWASHTVVVIKQHIL